MNPNQPFPSDEYEARLKRVREEMGRRSIDALVITAPENIYYLTGYFTKGNHAYQYLGVPANGSLFLCTREVEVTNARFIQDGSPLGDLIGYDGPKEDRAQDRMATFVGVLKRHLKGKSRVGVEKRFRWLAVADCEWLAETLTPSEVVDASDLVDSLRIVKSPREIAYLRQAGAISVRGMKAGVDAVRAGRTDNDVAAAALKTLIEAGGEWIATWPNVTCGKRTGLGHGTWQRAVIEPGDPVGIELAGVYRRYHAPLQRVVVVAPWRKDFVKIAETTRAAAKVGYAHLRPGVRAKDIYRRARAVIDDAGFGDLISYAFGYQVGIGMALSWMHQTAGRMLPNFDMELKPGMVFHMLTFVVRPNEFGIGESSTVVITDDGYEDLTPGIEMGTVFVG